MSSSRPRKSGDSRQAKRTPRQILGQPGFRARLTARALEDEAFRRELVVHPRAAIEAELGSVLGHRVRLPDDVQLRVHRESPKVFHFVCPGAAVTREEDNDLLLFWEHILRPAR